MVAYSTQQGKTTIAIQMIDEIISQFEESQCFFYDFERTTSKDRILGLTNRNPSEIAFDDDDDAENAKWIVRNNDIYTETLWAAIKTVADFKIAHKKELMTKNAYGESILPPTIFFVDSIMAMLPKAQEEDKELSSNMTITARAKINSELFRRLISVCHEANIIFMYINHIQDAIAIGVTPVSPKLNYLKQNESLPGGNSILYLSSGILKLVASTKLKPGEGYGLDGYEVKCTFIKSKSSSAGTEFSMFFDKVNGYQNDITLLEFLKTNKLVNGTGRGMTLPGKEDVKFSSSNFMEKMNSDKDFNDYFHKYAERALREFIKVPDRFKTDAQVDAEMVEEVYDTSAVSYSQEQIAEFNSGEALKAEEEESIFDFAANNTQSDENNN